MISLAAYEDVSLIFFFFFSVSASVSLLFLLSLPESHTNHVSLQGEEGPPSSVFSPGDAASEKMSSPQVLKYTCGAPPPFITEQTEQ